MPPRHRGPYGDDVGVFLLSEAAAVEERVETQEAEVSRTEGEDSRAEDVSIDNVEGTGSEAEGTGTEAEFDPKAFVSQQIGKEKPAAPQRELPGEDPFEAEEKRRQGRARTYYQRVTAALLPENRPQAVKSLADALDTDDVTAGAVLDKVIGPLVNELHSNYESYSTEAYEAAVKAALNDDEKKHYTAREYRNRTEKVKGLIATGKQLADTEWQGKVEAGDFIDRKTVETLVVKGRDELMAELRKAKRLTDAESEQRPNGTAPAITGRFNNESALNTAYTTPGNPMFQNHSAYAVEFKRLTGRDP